MRKVLKWGVVPLNLKGHGMTPHSLCWARINSPQFIRRFNHKYYKITKNIPVNLGGAPKAIQAVAHSAASFSARSAQRI